MHRKSLIFVLCTLSYRLNGFFWLISHYQVVLQSLNDSSEKLLEMTMQNKAFLEDAQPSRQHSGSYTDQNGSTTGYRHTGYVAGDILLDIINEGLLEKRIIDGYCQHYPTLKNYNV